MLHRVCRVILVACVAAAVSAFIAPTAMASGIAKELTAYRSLKVVLNPETAKDCYLQDSAGPLEAELAGKLAGLGLQKSDSSGIDVVLSVLNRSFGILGAECALQTTLTFQAYVPAANLTNLTPAQQAAVDRMGGLPVILWTSWSMAVTTNAQPSAGGRSVKGEATVVEMIDGMLAILKRERQ